MNPPPTIDLIEFNPDAAEMTLVEMRSIFQTTWQSSDTLDQKALLLVAASVIVLTLATFFQVTYDFSRSNLYWFIITCGVVSYALSVGFALWAVRPQAHQLPLTTNLDLLEREILLSTKEEATYQLIQSYATQTEYNLTVVKKKSTLIQWSAICLSISALLFFVSVAFSAT